MLSFGGNNQNDGCFMMAWSIGAGFASSTSDDVNQHLIMPRAGTLQNAYVQIQTSVGGTTTHTLLKNGSATSIVIALVDPATTGSDTTHTVSVVAGDTLKLKVNLTGVASLKTVFSMELV